MPVKRIRGSKEDQFRPPKRRSHVGSGRVNADKQGPSPDHRGAQQEVDFACQIENRRFVPRSREDITDMLQFRRISAPGDQTGKSEDRFCACAMTVAQRSANQYFSGLAEPG